MIVCNTSYIYVYNTVPVGCGVSSNDVSQIAHDNWASTGPLPSHPGNGAASIATYGVVIYVSRLPAAFSSTKHDKFRGI